MNYQIEAFIDVLVSKLFHLDRRLSYDLKLITNEFDYNKAFHGGVEITIRLDVFVIKVETVKWMINLLNDFNFNYNLSITRYLLDPKRNEIDEIPIEFQFHSNNEFYLSINPSTTRIKGRFVSKWSDDLGWHITNDNYYFKEFQKENKIMRAQPISIYPAQNN